MEQAVVRVSVAPVLASRSMTSEQVTQALLGAAVEVLERGDRWIKVRMEDGYEGWIAKGQLSISDFRFSIFDWEGETKNLPNPKSEIQNPKLTDWVSITDLWVNLRTRPDSRMPALTLACIGTCLPLAERQPGWLGVALPGGGVGWLEEHRGHVQPEGYRPPPPMPEALVATARCFMGVPYLWGGCSPLGLDCSGFVQLVFRLHGIRLPRDAHQQVERGSPVPLGGAKASDAVFFGAVDEPQRVVHVGLSMGSGAFIHAAGSDRVRVNDLSDPPYAGRLVGVRRYLACADAPGS
jgi:cell wall-associated NlpC family hydrolase